MKTTTTILAVLLAGLSTASAQLPDPGMKVDLSNTALVVTDPQNDFLSPDGVTWGVVGESVTRNGTVKHIGQLFAAAKKRGMLVAVSPALEQGFEVAVVTDATAAAIIGDIDGYKAAMTNFRMIANTVWTTEEAVAQINKATGESNVAAK